MNFWGEISNLEPKMEPPSGILQAAAQEISDKTQGRLVGQVTSVQTGDGRVLLRFSLELPDRGFSVELFRLSHPLTDLYPVNMEDTLDYYRQNSYANPETLKGALTGLFAEQRVRTIVANLLAQAN